MSWDVILVKTETNTEPMNEISEPVPINREAFLRHFGELSNKAKIYPDEIVLDEKEYSVEIRLDEEELSAITLNIRGAAVPVELLKMLCERLGCRAYDTSTDLFINFEIGVSGFTQWKDYRDRVLNASAQTDETEKRLPVVYSEQELDAVEAHIAEYFGKYEKVFHELASPDIHVDICVIEPTPERNYYVLVTMGMGAHRMNVPEELADNMIDRAEIFVTLPPDWKVSLDPEIAEDEKWYWPIRWLKILVRLPIEQNTWLGYGHTVPNGEPFAENTELSSVMLTTPYHPFEDEAVACELSDDDYVNFYQMLPLYEDEVSYKKENGAGVLEALFGNNDRVLDINRPSVCEKPYPGYLAALAKVHEIERVENAISGDAVIPETEIGELANALSRYGCAMAADGLEQAEDSLRLLFLCHSRFPNSDSIREALFTAALDIISKTSIVEEFDYAKAYRRKLFDMLTAAPDDKILSRVCANAVVLMIDGYLNCDPAEMEQAKDLYTELKQLTDRYANDLVMPAMLAWGKSCFIWDTVYTEGSDKAKTALLELQDFSKQHKNNALVAAEYANACYICFNGYIKRVDDDDDDDDDDDYIAPPDVSKLEKLLDEVERLCREYNTEYRKFDETEPVYKFPGYAADRLDKYFINMIWDLAQKYAADKSTELLENCLTRVQAMANPDEEVLYSRVLAQIISQLFAFYVKTRPKTAITLFSRLKELLQKFPNSAGKNADWLCSVAEGLIKEDAKRNAPMIRFLTEELKRTAEETDDQQTHSRYARILYDLWLCSPEGATDTQLEEKLYQYVLEHTVADNMAYNVAVRMVNALPELGERNEWEQMNLCYTRIKTLAGSEAYAESTGMIEVSALADFRVMNIASDVGHIPVAQSMFDSLVKLAAEHPENLEVITRLTDAGRNMLIDYEARNDLANADAVYRASMPYAISFIENDYIAGSLVGTAHVLCVDLVKSGNMARAAQVYNDVKDAKPEGDSAARLAWMKNNTEQVRKEKSIKGFFSSIFGRKEQAKIGVIKEFPVFENVDDPGIIKLLSNGSSWLIFEWFPLDDCSISEETLTVNMAAFIGAKVRRDDRERFIIASNNENVIKRAIEFLRSARASRTNINSGEKPSKSTPPPLPVACK